ATGYCITPGHDFVFGNKDVGRGSGAERPQCHEWTAWSRRRLPCKTKAARRGEGRRTAASVGDKTYCPEFCLTSFLVLTDPSGCSTVFCWTELLLPSELVVFFSLELTVRSQP